MNIDEYYDNISDISLLTREAIEGITKAQTKLQEALVAINKLKAQRNTPISFVSDSTVNDVHRNLLFFQLLVSQTFGLIGTAEIQELLEVTNYIPSDEEF